MINAASLKVMGKKNHPGYHIKKCIEKQDMLAKYGQLYFVYPPNISVLKLLHLQNKMIYGSCSLSFRLISLMSYKNPLALEEHSDCDGKQLQEWGVVTASITWVAQHPSHSVGVHQVCTEQTGLI